MKQPSTKELEILNHLWKIKKGFLKDIIEEFPDPKPAYTTVSTMLKRMVDKKYVDFKLHGRDKEYFPLLKKTTYFSGQIKKMVSSYFNNSPTQFATFFTKDSNLTVEELEELKNMLEEEITNKKQG